MHHPAATPATPSFSPVPEVSCAGGGSKVGETTTAQPRSRRSVDPSMGPVRAELPNGRWHFQHGPIDLVIGAEGDAAAVAGAHEAAWCRFRAVLGELVTELRSLRLPVRGPCALQGVIARRMWHACRPFHSAYITPMAAVAGSVAQEIIACYQRDGIDRAWVNNGGDIALHLAPGASVAVGLFADLARFDPALSDPDAPLQIDGRFRIDAAMNARGIAASGWRGRSFSLGIADSVCVLARTAAMADAAATVIANAVDVVDTRIERRPADSLKDDSDLGEMLVTVAVPPLPPDRVQAALQAGLRRADDLRRLGLIEAALLVCQGAALRSGGDAKGGLQDTFEWRRTPLEDLKANVGSPQLGSVFA